MSTQTRLYLAGEVITEITRRAACNPEWAQYLLLLKVASSVLDQAPQSIEACASLDVVNRFGDDLETMTRTIHQVFPGGLREAWHYYLPERAGLKAAHGQS